MSELTELQRFALEHKMFWWWVSDVTKLDEEAIVEGTLSFGDWKDCKKLETILGREREYEIFLKGIQTPRTNYRPETISYFNDYFQSHA